MYVNNVSDQPYGILSNYADTPFSSAGMEYLSVNEYVFMHVVNANNEMGRLQYRTGRRDAMLNMRALFDRYWQDRYTFHLFKAMDSYLNPQLLEHFGQNKIYIPGEPVVSDYINLKIKELSYSLIVLKAIVAGVRDTLKRGEDLPDETHIAALRDLAQYQNSVRDDDPALRHLDHLVSYLKFEKKHAEALAKYARELSAFKSRLLYARIKEIVKSDVNVQKMGVDKDTIVMKTIADTPKDEMEKAMEHVYRNYKNKDVPEALLRMVEPKLSEEVSFVPPPSLVVELEKGHDLSPFSNRPITIDAVVYPSPVHYAYGMLFKEENRLIRLNDYSMDKLKDLFQKVINFDDKLKAYTKIGMTLKFKTHTVLGHLLKTTGEEHIMYRDTPSTVLGVSLADIGENYVGKLLEEFRTKDYRDETNQRQLYQSPFQNVYFRQWIVLRVLDLVSTYRMFKLPADVTGIALDKLALDWLLQLYAFPRSNQLTFRTSIYGDMVIAVKQSLDIKFDTSMAMSVLSAIEPQIRTLQELSDENLTKTIVASQQQLIAQMSDINDGMKAGVINFFRNYFNLHKDHLAVANYHQFAVRVLANSRAVAASSDVEVFAKAKSPRIVYWYMVAEKMKLLTPA